MSTPHTTRVAPNPSVARDDGTAPPAVADRTRDAAGRADRPRGRRFPLYALAVTDQEGIWEWFRSRDPEKARRRAWRYAEALARCGGARVLPVTLIEAGRA